MRAPALRQVDLPLPPPPAAKARGGEDVALTLAQPPGVRVALRIGAEGPAVELGTKDLASALGLRSAGLRERIERDGPWALYGGDGQLGWWWERTAPTEPRTPEPFSPAEPWYRPEADVSARPRLRLVGSMERKTRPGQRPKTQPARKLSRRERLYAIDLRLTGASKRIPQRPTDPEECDTLTDEPCPYVGCQYNLYLDTDPDNGAIRYNHPDLEPWQMDPRKSCAYQVAQRGDHTLDQVGEMLNVSLERSRQIETEAIDELAAVLQVEPWDVRDALGALGKRSIGTEEAEESAQVDGDEWMDDPASGEG